MTRWDSKIDTSHTVSTFISFTVHLVLVKKCDLFAGEPNCIG